MLDAMTHSAFSDWLLQSGSVWAYPTVLTLHTFGMMVLVGASWVIDLRLLGFARGVPLRSVRTMFTVMWYAFAVNAVTGTMLFIANATKLATAPDFLLKMTFIALAIVTAVLIKRAIVGGTGDPAPVPGSGKGARRGIAVSVGRGDYRRPPDCVRGHIAMPDIATPGDIKHIPPADQSLPDRRDDPRAPAAPAVVRAEERAPPESQLRGVLPDRARDDSGVPERRRRG